MEEVKFESKGSTFEPFVDEASNRPGGRERMGTGSEVDTTLAAIEAKLRKWIEKNPRPKRLCKSATWEMLLDLRQISHTKLQQIAEKQLMHVLTPEEAEKLELFQLATKRVRKNLRNCLVAKDNLEGLITPEAVKKVFQQCVKLLTEKTQVEVFSLAKEVQEVVENYFENLVKMKKFPVFQKEFMRKLALMHLENRTRELEQAFKEAAVMCTAGERMDRDLDPQSITMRELRHIAAIACGVQLSDSLLDTCLSRVMSGQPELSAESVPERVRLEALCRFYMGCVNLAGELCTDPELLLWLKRILQALYQYPREKSVYENKFLNVLNRCAAIYRHEHFDFSDDLRYLVDHSTLPLSWPCEDLNWVYKTLKFYSYSGFPSLNCMLHLFNPDETDGSLWTSTEHLDVDRIVLQWSKHPAKDEQFSLSACALSAITTTLSTSFWHAAPVIAKGVLAFAQRKTRDSTETLAQAHEVGVYLGLLLAHRKFQHRFISLFGHCGGANTVLACLTEIATFNRQVSPQNRVYVMDVVLSLGTASANDVDWNLVRQPVKGRFVNMYSSSKKAEEKDETKPDLKKLALPIACTPVGEGGVENIDVAEMLKSLPSDKRITAGYQLRKLLKLIRYSH